MKVPLKSAGITDKESEFHNTVEDILISDGIITHISDQPGEVQVDKAIADTYAPQGWTDSSICFGEPGYKEREILANGMLTAGKSGFTYLLINLLTHPVTDSKATVTYIKDKMHCCVATTYPIGALTVESKIEYLVELYDIQSAGVAASGDYKKSTSNSNLLKIVLQYTQPFDGIVISFPNDAKIMGKGVVNEHIEGTCLGLKGIPALAEEPCVARDLSILEYVGGRLCTPTISTAKSVALIAEVKAKGLDVICSVVAHHLHFIDEVLDSFDINYKVLPPLRDTGNVFALREALDNGVIDFVTSDHNPLDIELKFKEFDLADFGTVGLENVWDVLSQYTIVERAVTLLITVRKRFGMAITPIAVNTVADLTLFTPEGTSVFTKEDILSASKNSAFIGATTKGKVLGVIVNNQLILSE